MPAVVADTHTIIWYLQNSNRLSATATIFLDETVQPGEPIYMCAISVV